MIGPTGHLYMGSSIGLAKIDPDTGQVLASFQTIGTAGMPALGPNGTIYVGSKSFKDKRLYAVTPEMTASWVFGPMFVEEDATPFPIVAADGVIYVGFGKGVYALTPTRHSSGATRRGIRSFPTPPSPATPPPTPAAPPSSIRAPSIGSSTRSRACGPARRSIMRRWPWRLTGP